jgi:hypothetical protein
MYKTEYFRMGEGSSMHVLPDLSEKLNEMLLKGWEFKQALPTSIGFILVYENKTPS